MTVMDYAALVQTTLGGAIALTGGFLGQWRWAERRAVVRERREREHEQKVWVRGIGYETHVQFISTYQRLYKALIAARIRDRVTQPREDYLVPLHDQMTSLRLVSQQATQDKAWIAISALDNYTYKGGKWPDVEMCFDRYLAAVREEFHLTPMEFVEDGLL